MGINKLSLVFITFLAALGCGAGNVVPPAAAPAESVTIGSANAPPPRVQWNDSESPVPVSDADPMWGDRSAPVTMVVFAGFQDPFSVRLEQALEQVRSAYGAAKVRVVWKNEPLPIHDKAKRAAEAAMGVFELAGNEGFWRFHALLFANQRDFSEASFLAWAEQAGVRDTAAFGRGLQMHQWLGRVEVDHELAQKVGVHLTPVSFINGVRMAGAQPFEALKKVIDAELEQVAAMAGIGVKPDRMYVERSKFAYTKRDDGQLDGPVNTLPNATTVPAAPDDVSAAPTTAKTTGSGLKYRTLTPGKGKQTPIDSNTVVVHYTGWTTDGKMFDSSLARGESAEFPVTAVIKGWTEMLKLMTTGQKVRVWIPAKLAYGDTPIRTGAPAGMLVFDIELLGIK
jgi:protein-disulfide isomerase